MIDNTEKRKSSQYIFQNIIFSSQPSNETMNTAEKYLKSCSYYLKNHYFKIFKYIYLSSSLLKIVAALGYQNY